jgi:hypothetical protein
MASAAAGGGEDGNGGVIVIPHVTGGKPHLKHHLIRRK